MTPSRLVEHSRIIDRKYCLRGFSNSLGRATRIHVNIACVSAFALLAHDISAQTVNLGSANGFAVLGGSGITNTGTTTINGNVGTFPTTSITGFETVTLNGVNQGGDAVTQQAKIDLVTAYNDAAGRAPTTVFAPASNLGGMTLVPGVYNNPSSFGITGTITLDALGNSDAVWIFQTGSTLNAANNSNVSLLNGANACRIFWQVGSSATIGTGANFAGNILALTSITLNTGASVSGRVLARNGAVTMNANTITLAVCPPEPTPGPTPGPTPRPTPRPGGLKPPGPTPTPTPSIAPESAVSVVTIVIPEDSRVLIIDSLLLVVPEDQFPEPFTSAYYQGLGILAIEQANAQNQFLTQRFTALRLGANRGFQSSGIESPLVYDKNGKSVADGKSAKNVVDIGDGRNVLVATPENRWGVWAQGNGIFGRVTQVSHVPNSRFQSGGVSVGADYRWNEHFTTGIFGGYQGVYSKYENGGSTKINTGLVGTYATYQNGGFYADGILSGGYSDYQLRRPIQFSVIDRTATAKPDGGYLSSYVDLGYDWKVSNFTFGPIIGAQYSYVSISPFTETGAGSLNLQVDRQDVHSLRSMIGGHIAYTWNITKNFALIPDLRFFWQHEFLNNSRNIDASLAEGDISGFGYQSGVQDRDAVNASIGLIAQIGSRWNANVYYTSNVGRSDFVSHAINGGLSFNF